MRHAAEAHDSSWGLLQLHLHGQHTVTMPPSRCTPDSNIDCQGTAVFVVGTTGKKRGILSFTFDGTTTPFDRTGSDLICDVVIFQKTGLPYQQHTVSGTFVSQQVNFASGELDGVLSVQRIRYVRMPRVVLDV